MNAGKYVEVGVLYCPVHDGVANEDDHRCDFAAADEEPHICDDHDPCGDEGEPRPCDFRQLMYREPAS